MVFPVMGKVEWSSTYNLDKDNGRRVHHGEDLMAAKMTPLVAVFDGTVQVHRPTRPNGHNRLTLVGDNGYTAQYMHINIDTPGTSDGKGSDDYAFVAGLKTGDRVIAGQLLAWVGNSGNARGGAPHCHFELTGAEGHINPAPSLNEAQHITAPTVNLPHANTLPKQGELRIDGIIRAVEKSQTTLIIDLLATTKPDGTSTSITVPKRMKVRYENAKIITTGSSGSRSSTSTPSSGQRVLLMGKGTTLENAMSANLLTIEEPLPEPVEKLAPLPTFASKRTEPSEPIQPRIPPPPTEVTPREEKPTNTEPPLVLPKPEVKPAKPEPPRADPKPFVPRRVAKFQSTEQEQSLFEGINAERKEKGLPPITLNLRLCRVARTHAKDMQESRALTHLGSDGSTPEERVKRSGYKPLQVRENVGHGTSDSNAVLHRWITQERVYHINLLDPNITEIGVGFVPAINAQQPAFWTVVLATPSSQEKRKE
jgi:uncharacterized protein YkwD